jgi:hypothetical protein
MRACGAVADRVADVSRREKKRSFCGCELILLGHLSFPFCIRAGDESAVEHQSIQGHSAALLLLLLRLLLLFLRLCFECTLPQNEFKQLNYHELLSPSFQPNLKHLQEAVSLWHDLETQHPSCFLPFVLSSGFAPLSSETGFCNL